MKPYADPNHYVIASVLGTGNIQIVSYSATASSPALMLQQGHWYNLLLTTDFTGGAFNDQININAQVNDLGVTGNDPPFPTGFTNAVLHDSILIADTDIEASITGTLWGGALYLDNFRFDGMKSFDNCVSTNTNENGWENTFSFSISNNTLTVLAEVDFQVFDVEILNLKGQKLMAGKNTTGIFKYNLTTLPDGFYFLSVANEKGRETKKFGLIK
jgi:Secretion system C-terminal sorting domain